MPPPTPTTPEEIIWDLLCRLYKLYGGDCANMPGYPGPPGTPPTTPAPPDANTAQFLWDLYTNQGPPPTPNADVLQELLDLLTEIENFLNSESNPADGTTTQALLNLIAAIRDDVT